MMKEERRGGGLMLWILSLIEEEKLISREPPRPYKVR
jgi:hypothetical protein